MFKWVIGLTTLAVVGGVVLIVLYLGDNPNQAQAAPHHSV